MCNRNLWRVENLWGAFWDPCKFRVTSSALCWSGLEGYGMSEVWGDLACWRCATRFGEIMHLMRGDYEASCCYAVGKLLHCAAALVPLGLPV